ncbi:MULTISPECIES: glutathione peroxidase [unclassified Acinetobacter]|uniref:glutathione peroxidase n=1 Tax=unclassified Acinetobacter TaxID=196816 RepID=UPI0035B7FD51
MMSIYQFSAQRLQGGEQSLNDYAGQVLLIVNTASACGFTPQYPGLEDLYQKYHQQGFSVLGFPCNQFGGQESKENSDIAQFCQINYGVSFPMFAKIDVKGSDAHPLFQYLTKHSKGFLTDGIKWNFTKFLINKQGEVIGRYAPTTKPEDICSDIEKALNA